VLKVKRGEQSSGRFLGKRKSWVNVAAGLIITVLGAYVYPTNNVVGVLVMLAGIAFLGDALGIIG